MVLNDLTEQGTILMLRKDKPIVVLSLFDGISCGLQALKNQGFIVEKYFASEIDKNAIKVSQDNHPEIIRLGDVTTVGFKNGALYSENGSWDIGQVDLVLAGSPCFVAGTTVDTQEGYKPIEGVVPGDYVLTHTNQYKKVLRIGGKVASNGLSLTAQGVVSTTTTTEHPYYVRSKVKGVFSDPYWKEAGNLVKGDYLGININQESINPFNLTEDECLVIGRYIADGHTRKDYRKTESRPNDRHWQLIISVGKDKIEGFSDKYKLKHSFYKHSQGVNRAVFSNKRLVEIVEAYCGTDSYTKAFHKVLLDLPLNLLSKVLEGYMDGDGCYTKGGFQATTVSKLLAISLSKVVNKVYGVGTSIDFFARPKTTVIEGRTVNQADTYTVRFQKERPKRAQYHIIEGVVWCPIRRVEILCDFFEVFNLEVEDDNSYTANSAIVHNCQGFSMAGKQLNFDDPRSKLYFEFKRILNECRGSTSEIKLHVDFLLENVNMKKEYIEYIENDLTCWSLKINSRHFSAQNRPRFYWTNLIDELDKLQMGFKIEKGTNPNITTILEDTDYNGVWTWPRGYNKGGTRLVDKVPCLTTSSWQHNFLVEKSDGSRRKFTPVECERAQGLPDGYTKVLSDNQRYIVLGNCWTVPVIEHLLSFEKEVNIDFMEDIA